MEEDSEGEDILMQQMNAFDKDQDMEYVKKSVEWNSFEDQKLSHIPFEPKDSDAEEPGTTREELKEFVQAPAVVRRRIGIISFALKQIYLSEVETIIDDNNPEGDEQDSGMQKYHKTRYAECLRCSE